MTDLFTGFSTQYPLSIPSDRGLFPVDVPPIPILGDPIFTFLYFLFFSSGSGNYVPSGGPTTDIPYVGPTSISREAFKGSRNIYIRINHTPFPPLISREASKKYPCIIISGDIPYQPFLGKSFPRQTVQKITPFPRKWEHACGSHTSADTGKYLDQQQKRF